MKRPQAQVAVLEAADAQEERRIDDVAAAAREIADADPEAFADLYEAARGDREGRERHE